jgi:hypothetical protein
VIKLLHVIPAQAGIQPFQQIAEELDPSLRWDDHLFRGFYSFRLSRWRKRPARVSANGEGGAS